MSVPSKLYKQGDIIFSEGQPSTCIYIVQRGTISIRKVNGPSKFVEVGRINPGEVIGEMAFFDRLPRSASAVAVTDVEALEITFNAMEKIYESIPSYMRTIMTAMATRLRKANDQIRKLGKGQG